MTADAILRIKRVAALRALARPIAAVAALDGQAGFGVLEVRLFSALRERAR